MIIAILLLLVCAFFNAAEISFVASDWVTMRNLVNKKIKGAKSALAALHNMDKLLTTTLVTTNLTIVAISIRAENILGETLSEPIIILLTTLLVFIFGEVLPKSVAVRNKERFAIILIKPCAVMYWLLYPLIFITYRTSQGVLKLFKSTPPATLHKFTREDIRIASIRTLPLREYNIISRLLDFRERKVTDIMVPKNKIIAVPATMSISQIKQIAHKSGYSTIVIYRTGIDEVIGVAKIRALLNAKKIEDIIQPCRFIEGTKTVELLFEELKGKETFFAIVKDKNGRTIGLITMEDIIEELFGEIEDEYDKI